MLNLLLDGIEAMYRTAVARDAELPAPIPPFLRMQTGDTDTSSLLSTAASIASSQARLVDDPEHARLLDEFAAECRDRSAQLEAVGD
jgi:hypothetical protein